MTHMSKHLEQRLCSQSTAGGWEGGDRLFLLQMSRARFSRDSWKEVDCRVGVGRDQSRLAAWREDVQPDRLCYHNQTQGDVSQAGTSSKPSGMVAVIVLWILGHIQNHKDEGQRGTAVIRQSQMVSLSTPLLRKLV